MNGDITVVGIVHGDHRIEDIGYVIPQGIAITIPGNLAYQSKDLWRGISQKCLFLLKSGSSIPVVGPVQTVKEHPDYKALELEILRKEELISNLKSQIRSLEKKIQEAVQAPSDPRLEEILGILKERPQTVVVQSIAVPAQAPVQAPMNDLISIEAPQFIPETIRPTVQDAQLETQKETSEGSGVAAASTELRKFRKRSQ